MYSHILKSKDFATYINTINNTHNNTHINNSIDNNNNNNNNNVLNSNSSDIINSIYNIHATKKERSKSFVSENSIHMHHK